LARWLAMPGLATCRRWVGAPKKLVEVVGCQPVDVVGNTSCQ
jgi:hypothetical protein